MKKQILSFLIALSILLSVGLPVFAAGGSTATAAATSSSSGSSSTGSSSEAERKMPTSPTEDAIKVGGQNSFTIWTYNGEALVEGADYSYDDSEKVLTILSDTPIAIKNTNSNDRTYDRIVVAKDVSANITLAGVNIDVWEDDNACAFLIIKDSTGSVTLTLADSTTNILRSSEKRAGLEKEGTSGSLTIRCAHSGESGHICDPATCGALEASSYTGNVDRLASGAGIGGGTSPVGTFYSAAVANITISGGNVAASSYRGAGIGSGSANASGAVSNITISGGNVTASSYSGAGIGGGRARSADSGAVSGITISGGCVTASSADSVGIGSGLSSASSAAVSSIAISGGSLKASSTNGCGIGRGGNDGEPEQASPVTPTDGKGNNVYLHPIDTTDKESVVINGVNYPLKHGDENKIYAYLPVGFHVIQTDDETQTVLVKSNGDIVTDPTPTVSTEDGFKVWCEDTTAYEIDSFGNLKIKKDCYIRVANNDQSTFTDRHIKITADSDKVNLTLAGVNIITDNSTYESPIDINAKTNSNHTITLETGTINKLKSFNRAGLNIGVAADENIDTTLTFRGTGTLNVSGKSGGILAESEKLSASLRFESGNITATTINEGSTNGSGAGIGTNTARPSEIVILGGKIEASGTTGAGIGIGCNDLIPKKSMSNIIIMGGEVTASSIHGAGIGIGSESTENTIENIKITGGTVKATSTNGAGIGDGASATETTISNITIENSTVTAKSGFGSGIGGGVYTQSTTHATIGAVTVDGGSVLAESGQEAVASIGYGMEAQSQPLDAIMPRNAAGKNVYLVTIANPNSETVTINGTAWTPINHTAVDPTDTNLYAYIPEMQTVLITCGSTSTKRFFAETAFTADAPVELYDAEGDKVDGYATINEAVNAAQNGYTVKLMKDIETGEAVDIRKVLTFDLNGKKLKNKSGSTNDFFTIYGNLTIKDSSENETGEINMASGAVSIREGSFTLESGTLKSSSGNAINVTINANTVTLKGGTVNGNINIARGATLYANGGTVIGNVTGSGTIDRSSTGTTIDTYTKFVGSTFDGSIYIENKAYPYQITFSNGSATPVGKLLLRGQTLVAPTDLIPEGEILIGWYDGTTKVDLATYLSGGTNGTERAPGRNYGLKAKFVSTELDRIGQAIKDLETAKNELDNALANKADASELTSKINGVNNAIANLQTELAGKAAATDLNTLKTTVETLKNAVQTLQTAQSSYATTSAMNTAIETAINTATSTLNTTISALTDRVTAAESKLNNLTTKADTTADELAEAIRDLSALTTTLNTVKGALENKDTELLGKINDINTALATAESTLNSAINSLTTRMTAAESKLNNLTTKADTTADELAEAIRDLSALTTTLNTVKGALESKDTELSGKINDINTALATAESTLNSAINSLTTRMTAAESKLNDLTTKADTTADELAEAIRDLSALTTTLNTVKGALENKDTELSGKINDINTALATAESTLNSAINSLTTRMTAAEKKVNDLTSSKADKSALTAAINELANLTTTLNTLEGTLNTKDSDLEAKIASAETTLKTAIDKVADDLTAAKDELTAAIANKADASTLNKAIDELNKAIANAEAVSKVYADVKDAALKAELTAAINTAKSAFEVSLEAAQKNLNDAKSALDKAIKDGDKELTDKITALDQAIKALETVAGNNTSADDKIKAELGSEIDAAKTALNEAIGALSERVKDAESDIEELKKEILTVVIVMTSLFVLSAAGTVTLTVLLKRKKIF